ncbi:MAG: hypothetical protein KA885_04895 [Spirochaetes bacterium]|nr:hypothetical protein [Spirochaetota bacterium]
MDKRIFPIGEKRYIIYAGQSSADNVSFLRIGNIEDLSDNIQKHIKYIVVGDIKNVDINLEKQNISLMEKGKTRYVCSDATRKELFSKLREVGVDTDSLYIKELSQDIDNISKIENKKHFFTIFYDNKNVKLVSNNEIFFDLFESRSDGKNIDREMKRLNNFIKTLDDMRSDCLKKVNYNFESVIKSDAKISDISLFIVQDDIYIPLSKGMFKTLGVSKESIDLNLNNSQRFSIGKEANLVILENGNKKFVITGIFTEGKVVESMTLYDYFCSFNTDNDEALYLINEYYKSLFEEVE